MLNKLKFMSLILFLVLLSCKREIKEQSSNSKEDNVILRDQNLPNDDTKLAKENGNLERQIKTTILPFDFEEYYEVCIATEESTTACNKNYPSYEFKEVQNFLNTNENVGEPLVFFLPAHENDYQPVIFAYTESDVEGYFLYIFKDNKEIANLEIGMMDGETIKDFIIRKDYTVEVYESFPMNKERNLLARYRITKAGEIQKINN